MRTLFSPNIDRVSRDSTTHGARAATVGSTLGDRLVVSVLPAHVSECERVRACIIMFVTINVFVFIRNAEQCAIMKTVAHGALANSAATVVAAAAQHSQITQTHTATEYSRIRCVPSHSLATSVCVCGVHAHIIPMRNRDRQRIGIMYQHICLAVPAHVCVHDFWRLVIRCY